MKDDESHWHYEEIKGCCEFANEEWECLDCEPEHGFVRWHASFHCPYCRGEGMPVDGKLS